jgi:outer membrane protein OmpA-like peptidoglycan-associated protein
MLVEVMMRLRSWIVVGMVAALGAVPALGQESDTRYSSEELSAILERDGGVAYRADDLRAILTPVRTRSLSAGSGPEPGEPGSGVVPDLQITFEFGSAKLTPQAVAQLDELAKAMKDDLLKTFRFQVNGHTDAVGSEKYNSWLSGERAASVVTYLTGQHGIDADRLQPEGWGETSLAMPQDPKHWANRRVEIKTLQ